MVKIKINNSNSILLIKIEVKIKIHQSSIINKTQSILKISNYLIGTLNLSFI